MSDLQHKDIKSINVDISIDYKDHKISYYREGKTFIITIYDEDTGLAEYRAEALYKKVYR